MGIPWEKINWQIFEEVSLHLAQRRFPEYYFERYLKQGNYQHGIDINGSAINIKANSRDSCTIQCKMTNILSVDDIKKIIKEFRKGQFFSVSGIFILCTTADLQKPELQNCIGELKNELYENKKLEFICWDRTFLESELKNHYDIVQHYFGIQIATDICFLPDRKNLITYKKVDNFISRRIRRLTAGNDDIDSYKFQDDKPQTLLSVLIEDIVFSKCICLLADAHEGKSTLLRQGAYDIAHSALQLTPLFIEIKTYNIQPVNQLLSINYPGWTTIPAKDLCIIIDGLDEATTDEFLKAVKYIHQFSLEVPSISIILSCRQLFYSHYGLESELPQFQFYRLLPLNELDVSAFVANEILKPDLFYKKVNALNVEHLLKNPFYLTYLVELYNKGKEIPNSSIGIVVRFTEDSFRMSDRKLAGGIPMKEKRNCYNMAIRKLAITLQIVGANVISLENMSEIFSSEEIELLKHSSLLTSRNEQWSFYTTFFQEQLAALALKDLDQNKLMSLISVGHNRRKIKTKWIQTVASLINILNVNDPLSVTLIELIQADNVEILAKCEPSKFTYEFRLRILQEIMFKCQQLNSVLQIIDAKILSLFVPDSIETVNLLINFIEGDFAVTVKMLACDIIKRLTSVTSEEKRLRNIIFDQLSNTKNLYYGRSLIKALMVSRLVKDADIDTLIKHDFIKEHYFRETIYEIIIMLNKVDQYYEFGLRGVGTLIEYNKEMSYAYSERSVERFLLASVNCDNLVRLLKRMTEEDWTNFYQHKLKGEDSFIGKLTGLAISIFNQSPENNRLFLAVVDFIETMGRKYMREEFQPLSNFFILTNTNWLAVRLFLYKGPVNYHWGIASIIKEESFDYLLNEVEDGRITSSELLSLANGMIYRGEVDLGSKLKNYLYDATGYNGEDDNMEWLALNKAENDRFEKDKECIISQEAFKEAVTEYFKLQGKSSVEEEDIEIYPDIKPTRALVKSNFLFHFLFHWMNGKSNTVSLKDCLTTIDDKESFDIFRIRMILDYRIELVKGHDGLLLRLLREIYNYYLSAVDITNPYIEKEGRFSMSRMVWCLRECYIKFRFETPVDILLEMIAWDDAGLRSLKNNINNNREISQCIIEDLNGKYAEKIKRWVLNKLESGVPWYDVQGTLVSLCEYLNIHEAKDYIGYLINENVFYEFDLNQAADVYIALGGERGKLATVFYRQETGSYAHLHLAYLLLDIMPDALMPSLIECMEMADLDINRRRRAAIYLSRMGCIDGYSFLIDLIYKGGEMDDRYDEGLLTRKINTEEGLAILKKIAYVLFEPTIGRRIGVSVKEFILGSLYGFASKGEEDLIKVEKFIFTVVNEYSGEYPNSREMLYHIDRINEKLRDNTLGKMDISMVKYYIG